MAATGGMPNPASAKLGALQERFEGFERQMEDETRRRRESEETKLHVMRETM